MPRAARHARTPYALRGRRVEPPATASRRSGGTEDTLGDYAPRGDCLRTRSFEVSVRRVSLLAAIVLPLLLPASAARAQVGPAEYASRRAQLAASIADGVFVLTGADEPEADYLSFWQSPDFEYLTGLREPGAAMIMVKKGDAVTQFVFSAEKNPAREVWTGARLGPERAGAVTGMLGRKIGDLGKVLDSLLIDAPRVYVAHSEKLVDAVKVKRPQLAVADVGRDVQKLRGTKSATELACIRKAVAVTVEAQKHAMRAVRSGAYEFEIQALIEYTFRRSGADRPSFSTIVGSGPNSTTLHYNEDSRLMADGDVVVMDIGASYQGYAADVTRTLPVNGTYSPAQRDIYQIVRDAQAAAEKEATLGAPASKMATAASAVLAAGLARVGLIESADATYDCPENRQQKCPQYRLYYMHGLGHGIGLEVHDPDQYYFTQTIAPGSAFTIEPGIYVRENLLDVVAKTPRNEQMVNAIRAAHAKYRNIGVRIEDDYVATDKGVEWISRAPREMDEIEKVMREGAGTIAVNGGTVDASCGTGRVQP